jgi:hypothetical protein
MKYEEPENKKDPLMRRVFLISERVPLIDEVSPL